MSWAGTFHSVGNRLLRHYARQLKLDPQFSVLDRGDSADLMDGVRQELGLAQKEQRFPRKDTCLQIYSHRVNTQRPLKETLEAQFPWCAQWESDLTRLYRAYVERKQQYSLLDYDDLLLYWQIMMSHPRLAAHVGGHFDHVLVDEYQDTNRLQAEILYALQARWRRARGRRRRRPGDLFLPRRRGGKHPRLPRPFHAAGGGDHPGAELPLQAAGAGRCQRRDGGGARASTASTCCRPAAKGRGRAS